MNKIKIYSNIVIFLEIPVYLLIITSIFLSLDVIKQSYYFNNKDNFSKINIKIDSVSEISVSSNHSYFDYLTKINDKYYKVQDVTDVKINFDQIKNENKSLTVLFNKDLDTSIVYHPNIWKTFGFEILRNSFFCLCPFLLLLLIIYSKRQLKILAPNGVDDNYQPLKNPKDESV